MGVSKIWRATAITGRRLTVAIKPDIVAPGAVIGATENDDDQNSSSYTNSTSATAKDAAVNPDDPNNNSTLLEEARTGTSFASAAVAGSALLARQYFTDGFIQAA